jgi:hypothetical protein
MNTTHEELLIKLMLRGDKLLINKGVVGIESKSGKPVPHKWLSENSSSLMRELCKLTSIPMFEYVGNSVGDFGMNQSTKGYPGLCLQFVNIVTGEDACVIYNVDTKRKRDTKFGKKGTKLPKGQFNVGIRSNFYKFWTINNFPSPRRRSSFHDVLGKLKSYYFTGEVLSNNRFKDKKLTLLSISSEQIADAYQQYMINNQSATAKQRSSNLSKQLCVTTP